MAGVGAVPLAIPGGMPPGSLAACGQLPVISSGAAPTNGVKFRQHRMTFDQATDEHWCWSIPVPSNYTSGGTLRLWYGSDVTSGNVIWKASHGPLVTGTTDADTAVMNTVLTTAGLAVPATSGLVAVTTIAPDATNVAADEELLIMVGRDADAVGDTAAGDCWLVKARWEYVI